MRPRRIFLILIHFNTIPVMILLVSCIGPIRHIFSWLNIGTGKRTANMQSSVITILPQKSLTSACRCMANFYQWKSNLQKLSYIKCCIHMLVYCVYFSAYFSFSYFFLFIRIYVNFHVNCNMFAMFPSSTSPVAANNYHHPHQHYSNVANADITSKPLFNQYLFYNYLKLELGGISTQNVVDMLIYIF